MARTHFVRAFASASTTFAAALLAAGCGAVIDEGASACPPGTTCPPDDTDTGVVDTGGDTGPSPDTSYDTGYDSAYDSGFDTSYDTWWPDTPPDTGACGYGRCTPGDWCPIPCGSCSCMADGSWSCGGSSDCDSGVPDGWPDTYPVCPPYLPGAGTACTGPISCPYASPTCPGAYDFADCDGGTWRVSVATCPSGCPASTPSSGTPCRLPDGYECKWANSCGSVDYGVCGGGVWKVDAPCTVGGCPTARPYAGTECRLGFEPYCKYPNGCGGVDLAYCRGYWVYEYGGCPTPCPRTLPPEGSYCPVERQECSFPSTCGGGVDYAYCSAGSWRTKSACPGGCPASAPMSGAYCPSPGATMCTYPTRPGCTTNCFCANDYRWACYDPPCGAVDGGFVDAGSGTPPPTPVPD